jgi:DNA-binding response OmpR family regulator
MLDTKKKSGEALGKLLLADDEEAFRKTLAAVLEREGYECVCVHDGASVNALLGTQEFDALICDIHMPGNERLELIQNNPQIVEGLPIILLTGQPSVETAAKSVRLPVTAYLVKPPDLNELLGLLGQGIENYREHRAIAANRQRLQEWDRQLESIEATLRKPTAASASAAMAGYIQVTLRNLILLLLDLERTNAVVHPKAKGSAAPQQLDLLGALRRTVDVLEKTKRSFKSKDLGELRQQLEELLKTS